MSDELDLFGTAFDADPYATYARLREAGPAHRITARDGLYGWLVTRYDDARALLADPRLSKDPRLAPADWQEAGRGRPLEDRSGLGTHLLTTDPPDHTRLRRLVSSAFTARRVEGLRGRIQEIADSLVDAIEKRDGEVDLVAEFAAPLPVTVICELLGVPGGDRADFRRWTGDVISSDPDAPDARGEALAALYGFITDLIEARRAAGGDDLLGALIAAGDEQDRLTSAELVAMVFLLLLAGHETTVGLIGNGVLALLEHPAQLALLRERPDLLGAAVEEILRYDGPVEIATWRFTTEAVRVGGTEIPAGRPVLVALASADRDPDRFAEPDRLDIGRARPGHLAFGHGLHYCVGAALARVEGEVALGTLLRRLPDLALAVPADRVRRRRSLTMRGPAELPVTIGRRET